MEAVLGQSEVELMHGGVIAMLWAEGEDSSAAVLDVDGADVDLAQGDGGSEADTDADVDVDQAAIDEKIDGRKGSKEFREALKAWEATPEGAKFAKTARADHFRVQELATIEPGGISALRDKYALIESVGGAEGLATIQERVAEVDATDELLASGDPKALEALGPDFDPGLAKLTPAILERVMKSDPAAYAAAILPHLMSGLSGSPMVADLNRMVDVFQAPHLDDAGKVKALGNLLGKIGQWFEHNEKKAGELKSAPVDAKANELTERERTFEEKQQTAHWNNTISPPVVAYENQKLEELFKPYAAKLRLDAAGKAELFSLFKQKLKAAGNADTAYTKQMKIYRNQKNPDAATVQNFVKAAINRHAKGIVDKAVKTLYPGRAAAATSDKTTPIAGARTPAGNAGGLPTIVNVRPDPSTVDYGKTSEADQYKGIYTLKSGKKVKWVKPAQ